MEESKRCQACGAKLTGLETVCPGCGVGLTLSRIGDHEALQPKWSTDIIASIVALVVTLIASGLLGLGFSGMFFFWPVMMVVLLRSRWRHLNTQQITRRFLKLLAAIFALMIVVVSVLWAGCAILFSGRH